MKTKKIPNIPNSDTLLLDELPSDYDLENNGIIDQSKLNGLSSQEKSTYIEKQLWQSVITISANLAQIEKIDQDTPDGMDSNFIYGKVQLIQEKNKILKLLHDMESKKKDNDKAVNNISDVLVSEK